MPRPKGSKNRKKPEDEGYVRPGRKLGKTFIPRFSEQEMVENKYEILKLLESGKAMTITEACKSLNIDPARVYNWGQTDKDFHAMIQLCREVVADEIESSFRKHANFIPQMMLLKAYRPMFRDNYRLDIGSNKLEDLLEELRRLGRQPAKEEKVEEFEDRPIRPVLPEVYNKSPDSDSLDTNSTGENKDKEE